MRNLISSRISAAIRDKVFPGCVVGIVKKNGKRFIWPFGGFTYENNSEPVKEDTIYDVASITKSIPTASLALKLIDEGKLRLEDKLINFIPEFFNSDGEDVIIKHLLTQTLDFDFYLSNYKNLEPEKILNLIFTKEFKSRPGTK